MDECAFEFSIFWNHVMASADALVRIKLSE